MYFWQATETSDSFCQYKPGFSRWVAISSAHSSGYGSEADEIAVKQGMLLKRCFLSSKRHVTDSDGGCLFSVHGLWDPDYLTWVSTHRGTRSVWLDPHLALGRRRSDCTRELGKVCFSWTMSLIYMFPLWNQSQSNSTVSWNKTFAKCYMTSTVGECLPATFG